MLNHPTSPNISPISLLDANAAIPSHLHPVAFRSTTLTSSPRIAAASSLAEAQLRTGSGSTHVLAHHSDPADLLAQQSVKELDLAPAAQLPSPLQSDSEFQTVCHTPLPDPDHPAPRVSDSSRSCKQLSPKALVQAATNKAQVASIPPEVDVAGLSIQSESSPASYPALRKPTHSSISHVAGLQLDPTRYPLLSSLQTPQACRPHPAPSSAPAIRLITCAEYVEIYDAYLASASFVDESVVFPWLHCSDLSGTAQASYFAENPNAKIPPRYRGLTVVSADPELGPRSTTRHQPDPRLAASAGSSISQFPHKIRDRTRTRSLGASSTSSSNSFDSAATGSSSSLFTATDSVATTPTSPSTSVVSFDGPEPRASLLCSSLFAPDFLERCPHTGQLMGSFASPRLPATVNLRLFRQQAARYATVSDIVVYSETGLSNEALGLAQLIRAAQEECFRSRGGHGAGAIEYNVYVVSEPFEVFERDFNRVVSVDGWGYRRNKVDFFEREREEMAALTKASEIATHVWLGNSADVPMPREDPAPSRKRALAADRLSLVNSHFVKPEHDGNPVYDICIEAHDQALMASALQFQVNENYLDRVRQRGSGGGPQSKLTEIVHMEVPSTGQSCSGVGSRDKLVRYLVDLCVWVKKIATNSGDRAGQSTRKVLIHCHDGYTETSLFALAYVMYDRGCSLPEAYLCLQNEKGRSFFVYPADVQFLRRVESRIEQELYEQRRTMTQQRTTCEEPSRSSSFLRGRVSFSLSSTINGKASQSSPVLSCGPPTLRPSRGLHAWFYDSRFDGHFPSRILPFVYLGNLNHASNALMLKALGITHVVSMGESALVPPGASSRQAVVALPNGNPPSVVNSLWYEYASGQIDVLDMKGVADDGIDSIRPHIERAMGFIEQCRKAGGKVLVHCRVGVSRSATIVIGYVMKYLQMDLASAYLMVRSRRLNILIQPNLLFMWGLRRLESDLVKEDEHDHGSVVGGEIQSLEGLDEGVVAQGMERTNDETVMSKPRSCSSGGGGSSSAGGMVKNTGIHSRKVRMMGWSYLSREIAELNHRYLC